MEADQLGGLLHIPEPWYIDHIEFSLENKQLDVYVRIRKRALLVCPGCGATQQPIYDIADHDRTWRHLNIFEYPCYIHAELPRTVCGSCDKILRVDVPCASNQDHILPITLMR